MAFDTIVFKNSFTNQTRVAPVGLSWTVLFFGWFVPLFRSDWKWLAIMFLFGFLTLGLANFFFMFAYNKLHIKRLIENGFVVDKIFKNEIDFVEQKLGLSLPVYDDAPL